MREPVTWPGSPRTGRSSNSKGNIAETQAQVTHLPAQAVDQMQIKRYGGIPRETNLLRAALVFCSQERHFVAWQEVLPN